MLFTDIRSKIESRGAKWHVKHHKVSLHTFTQLKHHLCGEILRIMVIGCANDLIPQENNIVNIIPA